MNKLIIDLTNEKIFLMVITKDDIYSITKENTKNNYEKLTLIIKNFLNSNSLKLEDVNKIYVNKGPGSFSGIRNSLSTVKAFYVARKIDYYCYSFADFKDEIDIKYTLLKFKSKVPTARPIKVINI